jgi:hypothetical protein
LTELKRVGCYNGPIGPVWTPAARNSMKAFIRHVNATLPVEQPDQVLLAMVQGHRGQACGRAVACAAGFARDQQGRCLPVAAMAAQPPAKSQVPADRVPDDAELLPAGTSEPQGRMSLAGPKDGLARPSLVPGEGTASPGRPVPDGLADTEKQARPAIQTPRQRNTQGEQRSRAKASRTPGWVPWSQPWNVN